MATKIGFTQTGRALRIDTPLGADVLILRAVSGHETISQLFRFQLDLLSEDDSIDLESLLGQIVTIHVQKSDGEVCWNGHISRFSQGARDERFTHYRAEMVPWLWFLTRTADCRIFQNKTVPEIIQKIFADLNFTDFELKLYGSFRKWDYCVQYRETDFNFVSRLMEEEGIYYFVKHDPSGGKHTLVLANDAVAHQPCPGQAKARCELSSGGVDGEDRITEWSLEQEFRPSVWSHADFNFETPNTKLMATVKDKSGFEIYDYPGSFDKRDEGDQLARARLQETVAFKNRATGSSNCRCFGAGYLVEVTDHYRKDVNQKWLLTTVNHHVSMGSAYGTSGGGDEFFYSNTFECIPASVPFRAPRITPKPVVQGCQTAIVVGPKGEEIQTDKYGRVKVHFHWDREGAGKEDSSCWIRVSQYWAGQNWGSVSIPRIGQEVIVDFLEGDPDQPIIIGRVYNASQMPPYPLPAQAANMGFKSKSIKGGGYNELSINDTNATEGITIHAQYNMGTVVEHDQTTTVHNNRTETVDVDETITIGNNRKESVGVNESISIGKNRTETVGQNETVTVSMLRTHSVGINDMLNVGAAQEVSVGAAQAVTVGGAQAISVGLMRVVSVGMSQQTNVGKGMKTSVGTEYVLEGGNSITLKSGAASITMKKDGTIVIEGKDISIKGSGSIVEQAPTIDLN